jgi:hypothetical protein
MTNYFKWFSLEKAYNINHTLLRKAFLAKSMELHPDKSNIDEAELLLFRNIIIRRMLY